MRLVVDLQACQTGSRYRGIGRYAMNLAQAIASEMDEEDELVVAIDLAGASCARDVRKELRSRGVRAKVVAYGYPATMCTDILPAARVLAGKLRSRFFASLRPDVLLISSLFETGDSHSTELDWDVLAHIPTAVIGYDVIPMLFPYHYLLAGGFGVDWYRARLNDLVKFDLILSISEATRRDLIVQLGIAAESIAVIGAGFDETLVSPPAEQNAESRLHELGVERPFILMVGNGDWRKNTLGALRAFASLPEPLRNAHQLVLTQVGDDVRDALAGEYVHLRDHVRVLDRVDDATLVLLYRECEVFYFPSYYEGFGLPVLEAMACGAPVLCSSAGSLREVVHDTRILFDPHEPGDGVALLERALTDIRFREEIRHHAREHALGFTWKKTARRAVDALHGLASRQGNGGNLAAIDPKWPENEDLALMADALGAVGEPGGLALEMGLRAIARGGKRRVLVDLTEMVRLDAGTGIHRVVRRFFEGLVNIALESRDFEVEPVHATQKGIFYARDFARTRLGASCAGPDAPVRVEPSDLVFMLDATWQVPQRFDDLYAQVHAAGGEVVWMVYDLIPIRIPETCNPLVPPAFEAWLEHAVHWADGFVCISEATRTDLLAFMDSLLDPDAQRPWTCSVHLGCDMAPAVDKQAFEAGEACRSAIGDRPYFTALGTVEPRKDYETVLAAFELLWARGKDVALVIIGKQGWNVDALVRRIARHPERNHRLFWLQRANDGDVRHLLEGSAALIQASMWEGFGLPLIEAGSLGVPLLASDISVFHEVAGEDAEYFPVGDAAAVADSVTKVLERPQVRTPRCVGAKNWREASADLAKALCVA